MKRFVMLSIIEICGTPCFYNEENASILYCCEGDMHSKIRSTLRADFYH